MTELPFGGSASAHKEYSSTCEMWFLSYIAEVTHVKTSAIQLRILAYIKDYEEIFQSFSVVISWH